MKLELHIDRLVLEGVAVDGAGALELALQERLHELLATGDLVPHIGAGLHVAALDGGRIDLTERMQGQLLGRVVAERLHGTLAAVAGSSPARSPAPGAFGGGHQ
jgi:hypothetical protein